jgi:2-phosphoglycerate kinase
VCVTSDRQKGSIKHFVILLNEFDYIVYNKYCSIIMIKQQEHLKKHQESATIVETEAESINTISILSNKKLNSSKYDFVKVRVWLENHYYVLSRFIVSRILSVTKVKFRDAVNISLQLKKRLVDLNLLNVSQAEMETHLFAIMKEYGYGGSERGQPIYRFRLMTHFHHQRVPLMIIMYGTGCVGKSTLATQLAERLNVPNVLQTDLILDVMSTFDQSLAPNEPVWLKKYESQDDFIEQYKKECIFMKSALQGDIEKCFNEGKAIIIEGSHIDPHLFLDVVYNMNLAKYNTSTSDTSDSNTNATTMSNSGLKKGIVVPFFLCVDKKDEHYLFIEQWLSARDDLCAIDALGNTFERRLEALANNFFYIQDYLVQNDLDPDARTRVDVNLHRLEDTLDYLHGKVLQVLEQAYEDKAF